MLILAFSETWSTPSEKIQFSNYHLLESKERLDSYGGIIIYVKENISFKRKLELEIDGDEWIWIDISQPKRKVLIGLFYRPPNSSSVIDENIEY